MLEVAALKPRDLALKTKAGEIAETRAVREGEFLAEVVYSELFELICVRNFEGNEASVSALDCSLHHQSVY